MNKKGFTLVELLAVVAIMAVIALIAVPNVVNMLDRGKREQTITDAKAMIAKAKYKFKLDNKDLSSNECETYSMSELGYIEVTEKDGTKHYTKKDGYDDYYIIGSVEVCLKNNKYVYYIDLRTENHCLGTDNCELVTEDSLNEQDIELVIDISNE